MEETKQERQLLNYHKYLTLWDEYEDKVQRHFLNKDKEQVGSRKGSAKARVSLDNKLLKK